MHLKMYMYKGIQVFHFVKIQMFKDKIEYNLVFYHFNAVI